jgi:hypothetical protein
MKNTKKEIERKREKKIDYNEFIEEATLYAHSELMLNGGKGLKDAMYLYISSALNLREQGRL